MEIIQNEGPEKYGLKMMSITLIATDRPTGKHYNNVRMHIFILSIRIFV